MLNDGGYVFTMMSKKSHYNTWKFTDKTEDGLIYCRAY